MVADGYNRIRVANTIIVPPAGIVGAKMHCFLAAFEFLL